MIEGETLLLFLVLLVGVTIILSILIKAGLEKIAFTYTFCISIAVINMLPI